MAILQRTLILLAILSASGSAKAQCLDYAADFRPTGMDGSVKAITVFDSGHGPEIIAGGLFQHANGDVVHGIARLEGSRWRPLVPEITGSCSALAVYDDGSGPALYIGGSTVLQIDGAPAGYLVRWNGVSADVPGGGTDGAITALEVFDDGTGSQLYSAGYFLHAGGVLTGAIARFDGNGWGALAGASLGVQGGHILCLHAGVDTIGPALFFGGDFLVAGGISASSLARWDAAGWSTVGNIPLVYNVYAVTTWISPTGPRVVVGGNFIVSGTNVSLVGEWDGTAWSNMAGGVYSFSPYPSWYPYALALAVFDSGSGPRVYASGNFVSAGGVPSAGVAAWDGSAWHSLGSSLVGMVGGGTAIARVLETLDVGAGPRLFLGGDFVRAGDALANDIASFDGTRFEALGAGDALAPYDPVKVMTTFDDGSGEALWLAGMTYGAGTLAPGKGAVRYDGHVWSAPPLDLQVLGFGTFDDGNGTRLYAAGSVVAPGTSAVMRWDGTAWTPLPGGPPPSSDCTSICSFDDGNGPAMYVGSYGATTLFRWRNHAWSAISPAPDNLVTNLAVFDDGNGPALYAGGFFEIVGGAQALSVARFDGTSWSSVGFPEGPLWNGANVTSMIVHDDGSGSKLYVGGWFNGRLMRFDGSSWYSFNLPTTNKVNALASFDEGTGHRPALYVANGPGFDSSPGVNQLLRWDGNTMSPVGSSLTGGAPVSQALSTFDDGTTRSLYVGGAFIHAGAHVSQGIARMDACGQTGELFCFGDGSSGACPCGNESAPSDRAGCRSSFGIGAVLRARGRASLSGDTMSLDGSAMTNSAVLYVQGAHRSSGVPFGDGIKCTAGPFVRLGTRTNVGGASSFPGGSGPSLSVKGQVFAPGTRYYQVRYRNAASFCTSDTFNYTNGVALVWGP